MFRYVAKGTPGRSFYEMMALHNVYFDSHMYPISYSFQKYENISYEAV